MKKNKEIWTIVLVILVLIIANYFFEKRKESLLLNTKNNLAIVTSITQTSKGPTVSYSYTVDGQKYISDYHGGSFIKVLDTIKIKYSIKDPSLSKVINFCYMKKYKDKCK